MEEEISITLKGDNEAGRDKDNHEEIQTVIENEESSDIRSEEITDEESVEEQSAIEIFSDKNDMNNRNETAAPAQDSLGNISSNKLKGTNSSTANADLAHSFNMSIGLVNSTMNDCRFCDLCPSCVGCDICSFADPSPQFSKPYTSY